MSVKSTRQSYDAMTTRWQMCRDAAQGEHSIHAAGELYLPKFPDEQPEAYKLRLMMTPFFNATWRTISGLKAMLFRKPPTVEVPNAILDALEDIDLAGTTIQGLAQKVCQEALTVGRVGLLVDYPTAPDEVRTLADSQALKLRTLISIYTAESIINWRTKRVNGATVLNMVVLKESAELPGENEFTVTNEDRYRVLDLDDSGKYRQRVYKVDKLSQLDIQIGEDIYPQLKASALTFIPFVFIGIDNTGPDVEAPPLIDLVSTNFKHYGQATSYERGCFFSGLPTMFISGYQEDQNKIHIGGNVANALPDPSAKAYFVEVQSEFNALRTNLEDKKREMAVLGARFLEQQKSGVEAADAIARRQSGEESQLSVMAQTASMGLTKALTWFAQWEGVEGEIKYELNRDFMPATMDAQTLTALVSAWQGGAFSQETLFNNLKAGEIIADDVTFEEEQGRTTEQGPIMTAPKQLAA